MKKSCGFVKAAVVCAGLFAFHASGVDMTWTGNAGDNEWLTAENWDPVRVPIAGDVTIFNAVGGAVNVSDTCTNKSIRVIGSVDVTLNIAGGKILLVSNSGGEGMQATGANLTINGPGQLGHTTAGGTNHLDDGANPGRTLTVNAQLVAVDGGTGTGFETWVADAGKGGTVVLGYTANTFTMNVAVGNGHVVVASVLANIGQPSCIGAASVGFYAARGSVLRYTGPAVDTNIGILQNGGDAILGYGGGVEQEGSGILTLAGPVYNSNNSSSTFLLGGDSAFEGRVTGPVYNAQNVVGVRKYGSGTWVLAGSNSFTGAITINAGTLALDSTNAAGNAASITMTDGAMLSVNPSATDDYTLSLPALSVPGGSAALTIADAPTASAVTFANLSGTGLAITAPNAGSAANRIFVTGFQAGIVGPWLTLNGSAAQYDAVNGLTPVAISTQYLATKGNALPDGDTVEAIINAPGTGLDIWLDFNPTTLFSLTQAFAGDDAKVNLAGQTLFANELAIAAGAGALTIGDAPQDGLFLPTGLTATPLPDANAIAALNPLIWYDPSDSATVALADNGTVTNIVNKGSLANADAVVRSGHTAPIYATGAVSHSALPMLRNTVANQGLQSAVNTGISGDANRTLIAVMSRNASQECLVSIGVATSGLAFETYLRNDYTRFGTYSGDIDMAASPPETPIVMAFLSGVEMNGTVANGNFQGFADGVAAAAGPKTRNDLNTTDTPLHLGHRNGGGTYPGQIGEVLLFDYTLSVAERKMVEAYLIAKWKAPGTAAVVAEQKASLSLRNDSAEALTVNAALNEPYDSIVSLTKTGEGDVTLAGGTRLSGPVLIDAGALTVATPDGVNDYLRGVTSGAGGLVKDGGGTLTLPSAIANTYLGGTDILGGILRVGNSRSLSTGEVVIADGGTLDIGGGVGTTSFTINNPVFVSGAGVDGLGAIVNNGVFEQRNAFQNMTATLLDDATFGGIAGARWDFRGAGAIFDLNSHTLTKAGMANLFFSAGGSILNAPSGTALHITQGSVYFESGLILEPNDSTPEIIIDGDARFGMYELVNPVNWTFLPAANAEIHAGGGNEGTNRNMLTSAMALPGTLNLTANGNFNKTLSGVLSGPGGLAVSNGGVRAMSLLDNPANTFGGTVFVTNAVLGLRYPGSLPDANKVTLRDNGCLRVFMNPGGWASADVAALAANPLIYNANLQRLQVQVDLGETATLTHDIGSASAPFPSHIDKHGQGTLVIDADVTVNAQTRMNNGTIELINDSVWSSGILNMYMQDYTLNDASTSHLSTIIVRDNAQWVFTDQGRNPGNGAAQFRIPQNNGRAVVELKDSGFIQSNLIMGGYDNNTGTHGAVYQSGDDSRWLCTASNGNDGRIGRYGYGYYQLDGGDLTIKGWTHLGGINNATSVGILRQTGGAFSFNGKRYTPLPNTGEFGNSYDGCFGLSRGGVGVLHLEGGTFEHYGELLVLDGNDGGSGNATPGTAIMTVAGTADAMVDREVQIGNRASALAVLNLNGGKLTTTYIRRMNRTTTGVFVNFNGGTLCVTNNAGNQYLFAVEGSADFANAGIKPLDINIYGGGATIELGEGVTRTIDRPMARPEGTGIGEIRLNGGGMDYIAPPYVRINGGGGTNATAIAHIDRETGALTHIEITNPGQGYTSQPTITLIGGGGSNVTWRTPVARFADHGDGGLTKTGPGTLILSVPNAYTGPTRVDGGTLRLAHPEAIPAGSEIIIGDGTLDLGGNTITNASVTLAGSGGVINGTVVTASAVKTGSGTAFLDAGIEFADVDTGLIPGLWEGWRKGEPNDYFNLDFPNPKSSVQLTTRAGNISPSIANNTGIAAPFWNNNQNMWIYTGYIWNRDATNVTWSWRAAFDDNVSLMLDGIQIFNISGNNPATRNYTLTPGPHPIEIRFGDNTGNVGAYSSLASGVVYDPQGRGTANAGDYIILEDDGTGYLLTANINEVEQTASAIRVEEGTLLLPAVEPGLWEGHRQVAAAPYWDIYYPNPQESIQSTTRAGNFTAPNQSNAQADRVAFWGGNYNMWIYTGYVWNRSETNETWTWRGVFDDNSSLKIDGVQLFDQGGNNPTYANTVLSPGAHAVEIRFGDGTGSVGPYSGDSGMLCDRQGRDFRSTVTADLRNYYEVLTDPGDGSLFSLTPFGMSSMQVVIDLAPGATLDLGGGTREGITVTGSGTVVNGSLGSGSILSPGGDDHTATLSVDNITSLDGLTYRLTIHDPANPPAAPAFTPGLLEYHWKASDGLTYWVFGAPIPTTLVSTQLVTRAGNQPFGANGTDPRTFFWANNCNMWTYKGYVWNRDPTNVTWTWRGKFDDNVSLILDGKILINTGTGTVYVNHTLTPGPHPIEIRYGDNTGNVGANDTPFVGGLSYDPLGRNDQTAGGLSNYIQLADDGSGTLLTVEAELTAVIGDDGVCDKITSAGTLDLTGLTIVPSDLASELPPGSKYVIAEAAGFAGIPTLDGFEPKWKTLKKGTELWLTTQGGTILILR